MTDKLLASLAYDKMYIPLEEASSYYISEAFDYYLELMGFNDNGAHCDEFYQGFQNGTFWLKSYHWGECTCGGDSSEMTSPELHTAECLIYKPNFIFTKKNFMLSWYKHPLRSAHANKTITLQEFHDMMEECLESMKQ